MASLEQVLSRLRKVSRACLPAAERVSPEIRRLVTKLRTAFSEPLVCSGISGRSSTSSSSSLLAWVRATAWSSSAKPVPAFGDEAAEGGLRAVGVQRDLGPVEHEQQLVLVGVGPGDGLVELGKAGDPGEDPIEALLQRRSADGCRVVLVELEISVEPPDQLTLQRNLTMLLVGHADDPAEMALGVDPTQGVLENVELTGIIGDDHGVGQPAAGDDGTDHGRLADPPTLTGAE